jgi:hypothetical protein
LHTSTLETPPHSAPPTLHHTRTTPPPPPVGDKDRIRLHTVEYESEASSGAACGNGVAGIDEDTCLALPEWAIRSGPRASVYFEPEKVRGVGFGYKELAARSADHNADRFVLTSSNCNSFRHAV